MNWIQNLVVKLLKITPAIEKEISIREGYTFQQNVLKNRIWYQGDPAELEQFYKKTSQWDCDKTKFWAATPNSQIRKMHSGIVSMVIDRYKDIVTQNYEGISFGDSEGNISELWKEIEKDNDLVKIIGQAVIGALSVGDGAFKISTDTISNYPIIEFYEADNVAFVHRYNRLQEIKFYTDYPQPSGNPFRLEETYGKGYIRYKLYDHKGRERKLDILPETKELTDTVFDSNFIMGVPFMVFESSKYKHRGKALFNTKADVLDALDETISQWLDAIRLGRIKRYIPEDLIPTDPNTGMKMQPNPFDNDFMEIENAIQEDGNPKIDISQPQIAYEAYLTSYISFMDLVLQGAMSPATLGIDLKKTDNADAQREKEKITLHVVGKIIDSLKDTLPVLVAAALKTYNLTLGKKFDVKEITSKFGEYASPDFDSTVEIISKAKSAMIMSTEMAVDKLYGNGLSEEEKEQEIARIKEEQGISVMEEPNINTSGLEMQQGEEEKSKALNGAQITSLMNVIGMAKQGTITRSEAISIISSTLGISRETAETYFEQNS